MSQLPLYPRSRLRAAMLALLTVISIVLPACSGAQPAAPKAGAVDLSNATLTVASPCRTCLARLLISSGQDQNSADTIEWADFDSATPLIEALKAGHVDVAEGGETGVLFGIANGTN